MRFILLLCFVISSYADESSVQKQVQSLSQEDKKPFTRLKTDEKVLALTFDDGPNAKITGRILEILKRQKVSATFFVVGKNIKKNPDLLARVHKEGHEIGNHSMTHPRLPSLDVEGVKSEIVGSQNLIQEQLGFKPVVFRAPYLKHDDKVWQVLSWAKLYSLNAQHYFDYKERGSLEGHAERCVKELKPGAVILIHEREVSLKFLEEFIQKAKAEGYRFLRASELIVL